MNTIQQDQELLLQNLCGRLPYGVKLDFYAHATDEHYVCKLVGIVPENGMPIIAETDCGSFTLLQEHVKPYLFPLSSLTQEQCYELGMISSELRDSWKYTRISIPLLLCNFKQIDFFYRYHIDFHGFIDRGLAIDATGKNIY